MQVRSIDPRGTAGEMESPTYRVYFWEPQATEKGATTGFKSVEHEISGARDVNEMLRWAEANAGGRSFTAYVVVGETLVRLSGQDPTGPT